MPDPARGRTPRRLAARLTDLQLQELYAIDPELALKEAERRCLKRERDRERRWRGRDRRPHERNMLHIDSVDFAEVEARDGSPGFISDGGKGSEAIVAACDPPAGGAPRKQKAQDARRRVANNMPYAMEVLNLVIDNGRDRETSICQLMEAMAARR